MFSEHILVAVCCVGGIGIFKLGFIKIITMNIHIVFTLHINILLFDENIVRTWFQMKIIMS